MIWHTVIHVFAVCCISLTVAQNEKFSVTFVIDDTSSMGEDLKQVLRGVTSIFETVHSSVDSRVDNFILVTFNDHLQGFHEPDLLIKTLNRKDFISKLGRIQIHGGGDCPEMALSGITLGLKNSLKGSYLFVFTDAVAKDHLLNMAVRNMAIQKEIQIIFLMTKTSCRYSETDPQYLVYHDLAKATKGQVFHLDKTDVGKILAYITDTISKKNAPSPVVSKSFPPGYGHEFKIPVDGDMKDVMIAESGKEAAIDVTSPDGTKSNLEIKVDLNNAKVMKIKNPVQGDYKCTVGSKSNTSVVVTADADVSFKHGFSITETISLNDTSNMPIKDEKSYLYIQVISDDEVILNTVLLESVDEKKIIELPLKMVDDKQKLYVSDDKVLAPKDLFNIVIKGLHVKSNTNITRYSRTPIEVQKVFDKVTNLPPTMNIEKGPTVKVKKNDSLSLVCKVKSYPKPDITWTDESGKVIPTDVSSVKLPYEYIAILYIEKVSADSIFKCEANNTEGAVSQNIKVKLDSWFRVLEKPKNTSIKYMNSEKIICKVDSNPTSEVTWQRNGETIKTNEDFDVDSSNILVIKQMLPHLVGGYSCIAKNDLTLDEMKFELMIIGVAPNISIDGPHKVVAQYDKPLTLTCRATGYPKPTITWYDDSTGKELVSSVPETTKTYEYERILQIEHTDKNATYKCKTSNSISENSATVIVEIAAYLIVTETPKDTSIEYIKSDEIHCKIDAHPPAEVVWKRNGTSLHTDENYEIKENPNVLVVKKMLPNLVGEYVCTASNEIKSEEMKFNISITGSAPNVTIDGPSKVAAEYDKPLTLSCQATGHPEPLLVWYDEGKDEELVSFDIAPGMKPFEYGRELRLEKVYKNATYKCKASNSFGDADAKVTVETVAYFKIVEPPADTIIKYKKEAKIFCEVEAQPPATIIWLRQLNPIENDEHFEISADNTTLTVRNMQPNLVDDYYCQLSNKNEYTHLLFSIEISGLIRPVIDKNVTEYAVLEGSSADIQCNVIQGKPAPTLSWKFQTNDMKTFELLNNTMNSIHFEEVSRDQSGRYRCIAENAAFTDRHTFVLTVEYPPNIEETEKRIQAEYKKKITLKCLVSGLPEPDVLWFINGTRLYKGIEYQIFRDNSMSFIASPDKAGVYNCSASNKHGNTSISQIVNVFEPSEFIVPYDTRIITSEGKDENLDCVVNGYPPPNITWLFLNSSASSEEPPKVIRTAVSPDTLQLKSLQLSQNGYYTCVARNEFSQTNMTYTVTVNGKPRIIDLTSNIIEAVEGDRIVRIPCTVIGRPKPDITWVNPKNLNVASDTKWYEIETDGSLIIKNIEESTTLTCVAENSLGSARKIYHVVVQKHPAPSNPSLTIVLKINEPGKIVCPLKYESADLVRWYKDDKLLSQPVEDQQFVLESVSDDDRGLYTCRVSSLTGPAQSTSVEVITTDVTDPRDTTHAIHETP